jgi:hypothetical protein
MNGAPVSHGGNWADARRPHRGWPACLAGAAISLTGAEVQAVTHLIPETSAELPDTERRPQLIPEAD